MDVTRIVVTSADRDLRTHPDPSTYVVHMPYDIFNVCSIKLVSAVLPKEAAYLVGFGSAQTVSVLLSGQPAPVAATLPAGNYGTGGADLALALKDALDAAAFASSASNEFSVAVDPHLDRFVIRSTMPFALDTSKMHPATIQVLGLRPNAQQSALLDASGDPAYPWVLNAPFRRCFDAPQRTAAVLRLRLPSAELLVSASQTLNRAFAILKPGRNDMDACPYEKRWAAPVSRLSRFHVEFVDAYSGNPYDFQNQDHRLEFVIESAPCMPAV